MPKQAADLFDNPFSHHDTAAITKQPILTISQVPTNLQIIFSGFVKWVSQDRKSIFDKIIIFSEIALIIDLISEIRLPTYRKNKVNLAIVLDIAPLFELLGLSGKRAQKAMETLFRLCKEKNIQVMTLSHIVDEMNEICYNASENRNGVSHYGSIDEAMRSDVDVEGIVRRVNKAPDAADRSAGINIMPYSSVGDIKSKEFFPDSWIEDFTDFLPYSKDKVMTRKRDSWSLAYAVRRQNGAHTSNAYESRCIILTRNSSFVLSAKNYLKCDEGGYPPYAVLPVMQLRQFSTMFLVSFGSAETQEIVRSDLISGCEQILRVSPELTKKIRDVLVKLDSLTSARIDAALHDPTIIAEFALSTANDAALISAENGAALLDIIRRSATKEAELQFLAEKASLQADYYQKMREQDAKIAEQDASIVDLLNQVTARSDDNKILLVTLKNQKSLSASIIAGEIETEVQIRWIAILTLVVITGGTAACDIIWKFTGLNSNYAKVLAGLLALAGFYNFVSPFFSSLAPHTIRLILTRRSMSRKLKRISDEEIRTQVAEMLGLE